MRGADAPTVLLDRVEAGRDLKVSTTTVQVFVGTAWREDRRVSVAPDGRVYIEQEDKEAAQGPVAGNPYKGLEAFHEEDADRFFGREAVIDRLWQRCRDLGHQLARNVPLRLLPVIGPSGCGKSSLVRAGLLPELARRPLPGLANPRVALLFPGSHPIVTLSAVLARIITGEQAPIEKQNEIIRVLSSKSDDGGYHGLRQIAPFLTAEGRPLIIGVDQFEEVWSLCNSSEEHAAFIAGLLEIAKEGDARVTVILTLRSDFLGSASAHPALSQAISQRAFLVPSMTDDELRRAITEPARRAGFDFDEGTVDLMVSQAEEREGALPLLQFALTRIWEGLKSGVPAAETLHQLGGVGGALAKEAERIYRDLPGADQRVVKRAFLAQVRLGEGARDSRRRAPLDEIVAQGEDRQHVLDVLRHFSQTNQRFITLAGDPNDGSVTAELCHEALLDHWESLRSWIDEGRADLRFQRRVQEAAEDWQAQRTRPEGLLWRSPQLDLLRDFYKRSAADMPPLQIAFFQESERYQRRQRLFRYATLATIFLAVLSAALVFLWQNYANWVDARPWARLVSLSTGRSYPLTQLTANVGRLTEGVKAVRHQVDLPERRISRIHLGISNTGTITDWRSFYGTTVNAQWLEYGHSTDLHDGDILTLSGLEVLRYRTITWQPWHYLRAPSLPNEPRSGGWAMLINGRTAVPIRSDQTFVVLRSEGIGLSDQPTSDAVLAVRRRVFHAGQSLILRPIRAIAFAGEDQPRVNYFSIATGTGPQACVVKTDEQVLTLQPLSTAAEQNFSSWIKEGDYYRRQIAMPADTETAIILENKEGSSHELGELMFETGAGPFQIVPFDTVDVEKICADDPQ